MSKAKPSVKELALLKVRERLEAEFPIAFPTDRALIQPLAIKTRDMLIEWAEQNEIKPRHLIDVLRAHCHRDCYRKKIVAGAMRIDIHGNPTEPVTAEAEQFTKEQLAIAEANAKLKADKLLRHQAAELKKKQKAELKKAAQKAAKTKPVVKVKSKTEAAALTSPPPTVVVKKKRTFTPS